MQIGVLGTGTVGRTISGKLVALGHAVKMGSRSEDNRRAFPEIRVVKALNMVNADVMVNPSRVHGGHDALICGNDAAAKAQVTSILRDWFGWSEVIDLGNISGARGMEGYLLLWLS